MAGSEAERRLLAQAARQLGLFTTQDLDAAGVSRQMAKRRADAGVWERVHPGVYRIGGYPRSYRQRVLAAALFHGPGAVASHHTAAAIWRIPGFLSDGAIEITKLRGRSQRGPTGVIHGTLVLPDSHCTLQAFVPITSAARTVFDLAGAVRPARLERALDNVIGAGLATIGSLQVTFAELAGRGRSGTAVLRPLLDRRAAGYLATTSELEALARALIAEAGLPSPATEVDLGTGDQWLGRVDLLYRAERLVIELDSRRHHTALLDWQSDLQRSNHVILAGWRVLRFTWDDLTERPQEFVAQLRAALAA